MDGSVDFLAQFPLWSREGLKPASKSEIRRWIKAGAVWFNGETVSEDEKIDFPIISLVLFPKGKKITLY